MTDMRGGKDYDARFGVRMRGEGVYAQLLAHRFASARKKSGMAMATPRVLDSTRFKLPRVQPAPSSPQLSLF